jgi:hypothetical protein
MGEATVYYEYFRGRAASCRRSAAGENAWLADVSLELADMYEQMAEESLARDLAKFARRSPCVYLKNPDEDRAPVSPKSSSPARRYLFAVYNFVGVI